MRINQYLAACGVASRRASEKYVIEGRVTINGKVQTNLAATVAGSDIVALDGKVIEPDTKHIYLMLHKPKGYVTTTSDELGRKTVMDLVKIKNKRLFPVGRLDYETEGLLLITSDGDLANKLTHPSHTVPKTYIAKIEGIIEPFQIQQLRDGVVIDGVKTQKARVTLLDMDERFSRLEITITEGRNRQIRKMLESIGKNTAFLKRTAIGDLKLGGLARGETRALKQNEIGYLKGL